MRLNELQPETEYADRNGNLILTGKKIEKAWYKAYTPKSGGRKYRKVQPPALKEDPWGKAKYVDHELAEGVLVEIYEHDQEGKRTNLHQQWVCQPRDIGGTWELYLELHGKDIRTQFMRHDASRAAQVERSRMAEALRSAGLDDYNKVQTDVFWTVELEGETVHRMGYLPHGTHPLSYELRTTVTLDAETLLIKLGHSL